MDKDEFERIIDNPGRLLGSGCYSNVYDAGGGWVLKSGDCFDQLCWEYLHWCHLRLLKFGARSPEMRGFPIVLAIDVDRNYAVMRKMRPLTLEEGRHRGYLDRMVALRGAVSILTKLFGRPDDLHGGNVMVDEVRNCYVITDPYCSGAALVGETMPQPRRRSNKPAAWKQPRYGQRV